ncbi:MAG: Hpt domain-containing protein [Desulfamplus sp.]|nr:Hpt domain-containing protein [Desulfamplus sp.]
MTQDNIIDHFRQEFYQEARDILEAISDDVLKLEADPGNDALLNAVFRGIHTIKGSAGSFELTLISDFTHHLEGILNALRDHRLTLTPELVDVILSGSDQISGMIEISASGSTPELNFELIDRMKVFLDAIQETPEQTNQGQQSGTQGQQSGTEKFHSQKRGQGRGEGMEDREGQEVEKGQGDFADRQLERETLEKGTIEKGTIEKGTIEKGTIEKGTIEKGGIKKDCIKKGTTEREGLVKISSLTEDIPAMTADAFDQEALLGKKIYQVTLNYTSAHFENGYDPMVFLKSLHQNSSLYYARLPETNPVPDLKLFEPLQLYLNPAIYVATEMTREELLDMVFDEELISVETLCDPSVSAFRASEPDAGDSPLQNGDMASRTDVARPASPSNAQWNSGAGSNLMDDIVGSEGAMAEFIEGSLEMIQVAERAVMTYEESASSSALDELFRSIHNIKGDADLMGFKELVTFTHAFESLLDMVRQNRISRTSELVELTLGAVDFIRSAISEISKKRPVPPLGSLYKNICRHLDAVDSSLSDGSRNQGQERGSSQGISPLFNIADDELSDVYLEQMLQFKSILMQYIDGLSPSDKLSVMRTLRDIAGAAGMVGHDTLQGAAREALGKLDMLKTGVKESQKKDSGQGKRKGERKGERREESGEEEKWQERDAFVKTALEPYLGEVMAAMDELFGQPKRIGEILVAQGKIKEEDISLALESQKPVGQILIESGKLSKADLDSALMKQKLLSSVQKKKTDDAPQTVKTMRVDEQKVESFSNLVGEMLIARNTYSYLLGRIAASKDGLETASIIKDLKENLHLFSRLTNDVQHGVISLRMVPVRGIFQKFSRVVRDISRKQNKMIHMMTDGEDIEIDKKVSDLLSDPLVHLIRNACDHGIETPIERKKAGKPEKGTVLLKASREGSNVVIRIHDDGRGINRKKLFEKAVKLGFDFSSPEDTALLDMIFLPGLSTADKVTDVSGRGVGMDVVKTTIQSLGGTVSVMSEEGAGTRLTLTLPTSMGIDTVLLVEAGGNSYAIPITSILETLKVSPNTFIRAGDQLMFHYRGEVLSAHFLGDLLNLNMRDRQAQDGVFSSGEEISMVILKTSRDRYGVIIDRFDKNMEIAVKPLPGMLSDLDVISGISILGDGQVLLVINTENI